jgi:hypothetical protein
MEGNAKETSHLFYHPMTTSDDDLAKAVSLWKLERPYESHREEWGKRQTFYVGSLRVKVRELRTVVEPLGNERNCRRLV